MKTLFPLITVPVLVLAVGCSTTHHDSKSQAASAKPQATASETVLVTYYPAAGKDKELEAALTQAWHVYEKEHLVYKEPHTIVRGNEGEGKSYYVEIFTWKEPPNHPPADVNTVWGQEQSLCEPRDGHKGIEGGPVDAVPSKS
jgi:hypothetical protein